MGRSIDATFDVNVDVEGHHATWLTAGYPPEEEGEFAGVLYFDVLDPDRNATDYVQIPGPPGPAGEDGQDGTNIPDGFHLPLGETASDGSFDLEGDVDLTATTPVSLAIALVNGALKELRDEFDEFDPDVEVDGYHVPLGDVSSHGDGDFGDGAIALNPDMPVTEAVDRLNEILGLLVPAQPPEFPNAALSVSNAAGTSPRLVSGATDNAGSTIAAGDAVTRITASGVSSNTFGDVGPGDSGTVAALINGVTVGSRALTGAGDAGSYGGLVISDQKDYPVSTPGFWKSVDIALNAAAAAVGVNKARITHSGAGATNEVFFVRDSVTGAPAVTGASISLIGNGTLAYSSGVPHFGNGASVSATFSISNLSGQTYYGGADPFVISGPVIASKTVTYADMGVTVPIAANVTGATAMTAQTVAIDGTGHTSGKLSGTARNVNGSSAATDLNGATILIKRGSAGARIDENSVGVSGLGSTPNANAAVRVGLGAGDKPAGTPSAWDSSAAIATHDATVVAGILKHDQINYAASYLPAGPNLSTGRSGAQYVTFSFQRAARSTFKINVTGSYAGCWVRLPGASDDQPNAVNGWWDGFKLYDGSGVPGESGDTDAGCALGTAMTGGSGAFTITFGTESSTNADGNEILVRFRLNAGQTITALSFSN